LLVLLLLLLSTEAIAVAASVAGALSVFEAGDATAAVTAA